MSIPDNCSDLSTALSEGDMEDGSLVLVKHSNNKKLSSVRTAVATMMPREENLTDLHKACLEGRLNAVQAILHQGSNVASSLGSLVHVASDPNGFTPLHCACQGGHVSIVKYLLGKQNALVDVASTTTKGETPLYFACQSGRLDIVQYLVEQVGVEITSHNGHGYSHGRSTNGNHPTAAIKPCLQVAIDEGHVEVIRYLLERDASQVNMRDEQQSTPLHWACHKPTSRLNVVEILLSYEADMDSMDARGNTPLDLALTVNRMDLARCLLAMKYERDPQSRNGRANAIQGTSPRLPVRSASMIRKLTTRWNVNATDPRGQTPLHHACQKRNNKLARILIQLGANVQLPDVGGLTPLEMACHVNNHALIRYMVVHGHKADLNATDLYGHTLLHRLCLHDGPVATVETILQLGAEVNCMDHGGRTPLHLACQSGHVEIAQCLLDHTATHVNAADHDGHTALHLVCGRSIIPLVQHKRTVLQLLLEHPQINVNPYDGQECTPLHVACRWGHVDLTQRLLERADIQVNAKEKNGLTPLHFASRYGNLTLIQVLMQHACIDVNATDCHGQTPLHLATQGAHWSVVTKLLSWAKHIATAIVNQADKNGWTALMLACLHDNVSAVQSLVEDFEADVICQAKDGTTTPLSVSCQAGHLDVIYYLIRQHRLHLELVEE